MQKCLSKSFKVFYKIKTKNKRVADEKMTEIILIAKRTNKYNKYNGECKDLFQFIKTTKFAGSVGTTSGKNISTN